MLLHRSVRDGAIADVGRAIAMAFGGALAFAPIEYALTLGAYAGTSRVRSKLELAALTATLALVLFLLLAVATAAILVGYRLVHAQRGGAAGRAPGLAATSVTVPDDGVRPTVPRVWALVVTAGVLGLGLQRGAATALAAFKEPQLTAAVIAALGIVGAGVATVLAQVLTVVAGAAARAVAPILGQASPLGRWRAAGLALIALLAGGLVACWFALPQSRSVLPLRGTASAVVIALGMGLGARAHALRGAPPAAPAARRVALAVLGLAAVALAWVALPGARWAQGVRGGLAAASLVLLLVLGSALRLPRARSRGRALAVAGAALGLTVSTLMWWGAAVEAKYIAITASPALDRLIGVVRTANDLDRDGFGTVLGEADCAPLDRRVHPGAIDTPDDHIDQNCDGRDFSLASLVTPTGPTVAIPPQFKQSWNVLLITIDTVRYDRTSFGGYAAGPKHRDTTPRLAELVKRSTTFTFAQAPSAGTMASIPAILTSKYFHSGIALGDAAPGIPPKILPENTTLPEIMKRRGYRTGVIGSHEWWNDWGLDQGVDDYDNSIGKTSDPFRVAADKVTDHALAWISRQQARTWFLWAHYIDPHGRYVAHPNVVDYGAAETDLYDAELRWTDQEIGRLLEELRRLPSNDHTLIIITSDHGDSMAEHNVPLGTHGTALYREMLHVPLIIYVPNNVARTLGGAVTPLDIVPTIAELCGIDVSDLSFEGRSLVPQLFAGREDLARIVFAETNAPKKQRAAISAAWKLIYYLPTNVFELFDLAKDPWEKDNLAAQNPPALAVMKQALQQWMDRVLYARDPVFNQAYRQMSDVISADAPAAPTTGQTIANGAIELAGIGLASGAVLTPGSSVDIHVYLRPHQPVAAHLKFQLMAWPLTGEVTGPVPPTALRTPLRATADGAFPTDRWKPEDKVRERFTLVVPPTWTADRMVVGLVAAGPQGEREHPTGATPASDPTVAILGVLPVSVPAGSPTPPAP